MKKKSLFVIVFAIFILVLFIFMFKEKIVPYLAPLEKSVDVVRQIEHEQEVIIGITDKGIKDSDVLVVVEKLPEGFPISKPETLELPEAEYIEPDIIFGDNFIWLFTKNPPKKIGSFVVDKKLPLAFTYFSEEKITEDKKIIGKWALMSGEEGNLGEFRVSEQPPEIPFEEATEPSLEIAEENEVGLEELEEFFPKYIYDENNLVGTIVKAEVDNKTFFYVLAYDYDGGNVVSYYSPTEKSSYEYNDKNQLIKITENRITTTYEYDGDRVICVNCQEDASDVPESYSYDEEGNIIEYSVGNRIIKQEFNEERLIKVADEFGTANYNYDSKGNLIRIEDEGYFGESIEFNKCGTTEPEEYYDDKCNQIEDETYKYEYEGQGWLSKRTDKETGEITNYVYLDGLLKKVVYLDGSFDEYFYNSFGMYKLIDRFGSVYYLSPLDEISWLTKEEFFKIFGDENADEKIEAKELFIALESWNKAKIMTAVYNWLENE